MSRNYIILFLLTNIVHGSAYTTPKKCKLSNTRSTSPCAHSSSMLDRIWCPSYCILNNETKYPIPVLIPHSAKSPQRYYLLPEKKIIQSIPGLDQSIIIARKKIIPHHPGVTSITIKPKHTTTDNILTMRMSLQEY